MEDKTYEEILSIMDNMSKVMEYSPSVFNEIKEEYLRTHFLVQLNGQYEGKATGETFNLEGKTDISIKENGQNIFIAECKYWHGEKEFIEAINQLLGYVSWRDTKTSIILFNTNQNFSKVLSQIPEITQKHPNFKSYNVKYGDETSFRFIMKNKNDVDKEFILTVKCYNIPKKMNKDEKNSLLVLGGLALLAWLLNRKKKGKCPNCGYPVDEDHKTCPNCGQPLNWEGFK